VADYGKKYNVVGVSRNKREIPIKKNCGEAALGQISGGLLASFGAPGGEEEGKPIITKKEKTFEQKVGERNQKKDRKINCGDDARGNALRRGEESNQEVGERFEYPNALVRTKFRRILAGII